MHPTIGKKIFGISLTVLVLMFAVAAYSIHLTAKISDELDLLANRNIPLADAVSQVNLHIVEKGALLQQLFVMVDDADTAKTINHYKNKYTNISMEIDAEFRKIDQYLKFKKTNTVLKNKLNLLEGKYNLFKNAGLSLLKIRENKGHQEFKKAYLELDDYQSKIDDLILETRSYIADQTDHAVLKVEREERKLLYINTGLTLTATVFAIVLSILLTRYIVRAVHNLVRGTTRIEQGDLDTRVEITTGDEIGKLTHSFNAMVDGLRLKERIKETFGKYMDPRIVTNLIEGPDNLESEGQAREMTVMFIDMQGFTSISEKLNPDQLVRMTNLFFTHMTTAISNNNGIVDKFMGDCVMAYWGEPFTPAGDHARLACKAAEEALNNLPLLRNDIAKDLGAVGDDLAIDLRIGISTGVMVVGPIGSTTSKSFTVMGDPVNLGSRLEGANKAYGTRVILSEKTRELAGEGASVRELDLIRVKGKSEPTKIFELISIDGGSSQTAALDDFHQGLLAYRAQKWEEADDYFHRYQSKNVEDKAVKVYLERIETLKKQDLPPNWDGVWNFQTK